MWLVRVTIIKCQSIIIVVLCNSGCIYSDYDDIKYTVYRWGFPCLDYSFDVLISWSCNLDCTAGFTIFAFIWFLFRFFILLLFLLLLYIPSFTTCVLHWFSAVIILYTSSLLPDITLVLLYSNSWLAYSCFIQILWLP